MIFTGHVGRRRSIGILVSLSGLVEADPDAPCYYPSNNSTAWRAHGFYPCDPTAYITECCPQGYTCYSNAFCVVTTESIAFPNLTVGTALRGACTNPFWNNDICGDECLDSSNEQGNLQSCGGGLFCCAADFEAGICNCTSTGTGMVSFGNARPQTIFGVSANLPTQSPTFLPGPSHLSTLTSTSSSSYPSQTSVPSSRTSLGMSRSATTGPKSSLAATPAVSNSLPSSYDTTPINQKWQFKVGLGVGLGLGLGVPVLVIGLLYWRRHKRYRTARDQRAPILNNITTKAPPNGDPYIDLYHIPNPDTYRARNSRTDMLQDAPDDNPYDRRMQPPTISRYAE